MKRSFSLILVLVFLVCVPLAQSEARCDVQMEMDGNVLEVVLSHRREEPYAAVCVRDTVSMTVLQSDGSCLLFAEPVSVISDRSAPADWTLRVGMLEGGFLCTECAVTLDTRSVEYTVYRWDGASFVREKALKDPGDIRSDMLLDITDVSRNAVILYQEDRQKGIYGSLSAALKGELSPYGLSGSNTPDWAVEITDADFIETPDSGNGDDDPSEEPSPTPEPTPAPTPVPTPAPAAEPEPRSSPESSESAGTKIYVLAVSSVNLRTDPSINAERVDLLCAGKTAPFLSRCALDETGMLWYQVSYKGVPVWCSGDYSKLVHEKPVKKGR